MRRLEGAPTPKGSRSRRVIGRGGKRASRRLAGRTRGHSNVVQRWRRDATGQDTGQGQGQATESHGSSGTAGVSRLPRARLPPRSDNRPHLNPASSADQAPGTQHRERSTPHPPNETRVRGRQRRRSVQAHGAIAKAHRLKFLSARSVQDAVPASILPPTSAPRNEAPPCRSR